MVDVEREAGRVDRAIELQTLVLESLPPGRSDERVWELTKMARLQLEGGVVRPAALAYVEEAIAAATPGNAFLDNLLPLQAAVAIAVGAVSGRDPEAVLDEYVGARTGAERKSFVERVSDELDTLGLHEAAADTRASESHTKADAE